MSDNETMTPEEKLALAIDLFKKGATLKDIKGLDDKQMKSIYTMGCNFYNAGRLDDAEKVFRFLVLFDHRNQEYWIGMGAVQQVKHTYELAKVAYEYATMLDIKNPQPLYHLAECYLALGRIDDASDVLDALAEQCPATNDKNKLYQAKSQKLRELIKQAKDK